MYVPILLSGFIFGIKGGIVFGVLGGVVLGPFMPVDVAVGEMQDAANWLYRAGFFMLIGSLSGAASDGVKSYIRRLEWISRHDASTGLPNRNALFEALREITEAPASFVLAVIAVENAAELKSAFGFGVVDEAVLQLVKRFENNRALKGVYHTATSQAAVLIEKGSLETDEILNGLQKAAMEAVSYKGILIHPDARMGAVEISRAGEPPGALLQQAEAALNVAREKELDFAAYGPEIIAAAEENMVILGELKDAVENGALSLYYQPKISIPSGDVSGVEALIRWNHPERGNIPPGVFIPRAEQSTLIQLLTEFVLNEAMGQVMRWRELGVGLPAAVNISGRNLLQPGFVEMVSGLLKRFNLSGDFIELEVTEGALMADMERTAAELARLAELNIIISIDDFGTGYSSLQYLHRLPVSCVKIDRSFVSGVSSDRGAAYILEAAVMLAHKMGIKTVAEGVEDRQTYDFLKNIGCDFAQGFFISRPLAPDDFLSWHREWDGKHLVSDS